MHSIVHGSRHSAASHGHVLASPQTYEFTVELFFLGRRRTSYQALVAAAGVGPGQHVLDVGCGTGYLSRLVARSVGPNGMVIGIDPSESMVRYGSQKTASIANCEFQVGATEALPFPGDHFDVVVSSLVLHHLPEDLRLRALEEMRRVLRPSGTLLVAEARNPGHGVFGLLARALGYDCIAQQVERLDSLAAAAGLGDIRQGEVPPWLRYIVAVKNCQLDPFSAPQLQAAQANAAYNSSPECPLDSLLLSKRVGNFAGNCTVVLERRLADTDGSQVPASEQPARLARNNDPAAARGSGRLRLTVDWKSDALAQHNCHPPRKSALNGAEDVATITWSATILPSAHSTTYCPRSFLVTARTLTPNRTGSPNRCAYFSRYSVI